MYWIIGRSGCERDAILISQVLPSTDAIGTILMNKRHDLLNDLRSTSSGLDQVLEKTVPLGVAFHRMSIWSSHISSLLTPADAGLTTEERDLVAAAYDEGVLKVMIATCSLAAGINLPASKSNLWLSGGKISLRWSILHRFCAYFRH